MLQAVVFDLDDTLYDEAEYVNQAFAYTAAYLAEKLGAPSRKAALHGRMLELLERDGRGRIFDAICAETRAALSVEELVQIYRSTKPVLRLYPDAELLLQSLSEKQRSTGLITDGCSRVQHAKIAALGLDKRLDCVVVTDDFGLSKPQAAVYEKCLLALGCAASEAAYVGDNPQKDFIGAKTLGMDTFRIVREKGMHMRDEAEPEREAAHRIAALTELEGWL